MTAAAGAAPATPAPAAELAEESFHFGTVVEGSEVRHDFVLRNRGTAPLVIHRLKAG
jgi:hypothetical protein